jgi:hypothetical protein
MTLPVPASSTHCGTGVALILPARSLIYGTCAAPPSCYCSMVPAIWDWCGPARASTVPAFMGPPVPPCPCLYGSNNARLVWPCSCQHGPSIYGTRAVLPVPARSQHLRDSCGPARASMVPASRDWWCAPAYASKSMQYAPVWPCRCKYGPSITALVWACPFQHGPSITGLVWP